jgi:mannitol/fructose-specific phosphotransferase system IIA component (Ntr-type)
LVALPPPATTSPEAAIRFLVGHAQASAAAPDALAEAAFESALRREHFAPTAIGGSLALPHATAAELPQPARVLGHCESGVAWASPDGQPD